MGSVHPLRGALPSRPAICSPAAPATIRRVACAARWQDTPDGGNFLDLPVSWPAGPVPFVSLAAGVTAVVAAYVPSTAGIFPMSVAMQSGLYVCGSVEGFQSAVWVFLCVHGLEAMFALINCIQNRVPVKQASAWSALTFFVGLPVLMELDGKIKSARLAAKEAQ